MQTRLQIDKLTKNYTPMSAYVLGFIAADGYIHIDRRMVRIEIIKDDFDCVEHIFDSVGPWTKVFRERQNRQPQGTFTGTSKELIKYFIDYGYCNKNPALNIPQNLLHYWYRGFFDGDGCWYYNQKQYLRQMSIGGSVDQDWSFVTSQMDNLGMTYKVKQCYTKNGDSSIIQTCNKRSIQLWGDYIYQGQWFGLQRKLEKFKYMI